MLIHDLPLFRYILLNRNGSANLLEASSRNYNPLNTFHEIKSVSEHVFRRCPALEPDIPDRTRLQNNLAHLPTHVRVRIHLSLTAASFEKQKLTDSRLHPYLYQLVVEFRDVRIIALGVLNKPRSSFSINQNARLLLHPPGMTKGDDEVASAQAGHVSEGSDESFSPILEAPLPIRTVHRKGPSLAHKRWIAEYNSLCSNQCEGRISPVDASSAFPLPYKLPILHTRWRGQALARQRRSGGRRPSVGRPYDVSA